MFEKIERHTLSLAAEYAVASELCRRGIYAQLTLGNLKRTDLLIFAEGGGVAKIEVKAKQGRAWPSCKGIFEKGAFLVFVDYFRKDLHDRPDFYVLSVRSWQSCVKRQIKRIKERDPRKRVEISRENSLVLPDRIMRSGRPWTGMAVTPTLISHHKENWTRILKAVGVM